MMKLNRFLAIAVFLATYGAMVASDSFGIDYTWNITGTGTWSTTGNWDPNGLPAGSGDSIILTNGGTIDLGGSQTIGNIGAGGGTVGTLQNGSLYFSGNMYVKSGTIDVNLSNNTLGRLWIGGDPTATVYLGGTNDITYTDGWGTVIGYTGITGATGTVKLMGADALNGAGQSADIWNGTLDLNGQTAVRSAEIRFRSGAASSLINSSATAAWTAAPIGVMTGSTIGGSGDMTLSGVVQNNIPLTGDQGFTKIGAGKLTLSNVLSTFSGVLTVAEGTLSVADWTSDNTNGALGNSASKIVLGGATTMGTLEYTGGNIWPPNTIRGLDLAAGGGKVHLLFPAPLPGNDYRMQFVHIDGNRIVGSGGLTVDTSNGGAITSRFLIVGSSSYTGPTTVATNSELQANYSNDALDGTPFGAGTNGLGSAVTVDSGAYLTSYSHNGVQFVNTTLAIGSLAGSGTVRAEGGGTHTYKIGGDGTSTEFSGVIQDSIWGGGPTAVTKVGAGTQTFSGISSFSGPLNVEAGKLVLTNANSFTGAITVKGGTLSIPTWNLVSTPGPLGNSASAVVLGGTGTTGTLQYTGAGIGPGSDLRPISLAAGGMGEIYLSGLSAGREAAYVHIAGSKISGDGGLMVDTHYGAGLGSRFIIVGSASYTGPTVVETNSELQANYVTPGVDGTPFGAGTNGLGSAVTVNGGGTLTFYSGGNTATVAIGSLSGYGVVHAEHYDAGIHTLKVGGDNSYANFFGTIENGLGATIALTKVGSGAMFLGGTNTYTGDTTVDSGYLVTLNLAHAQGMGGPGVTGGFLSPGTRLVVNASGLVDLDDTNQTVAGLSGSGEVYSNVGDGIKGLTVSVANGVTETFSGVIGYAQTGNSMNMSFTKTGDGTQILSGVNLYTGNTTISGGTLSITHAFLNDASSVLISNSALMDLNFTGADTIAALYIDSSKMAAGTWGSAISGAEHISSRFTGTGMLSIVPEPSTIVLLATGLIGLLAFAWRKRR